MELRNDYAHPSEDRDPLGPGHAHRQSRTTSRCETGRSYNHEPRSEGPGGRNNPPLWMRCLR